MENTSETKGTFTYTYSAKEQEEIRQIREKYVRADREETPEVRLRKLDAKVSRGASAVSLPVGIVGALLMGVGMCCTMLPGWEKFFIPGIVVGVVGIAVASAAYPIYKHILRRRREKFAPEIIRLSDELLK